MPRLAIRVPERAELRQLDVLLYDSRANFLEREARVCSRVDLGDRLFHLDRETPPQRLENQRRRPVSARHRAGVDARDGKRLDVPRHF